MRREHIVKSLLKGDTTDDILGKNHSQNGFNIESFYIILAIDKGIKSIPIIYSKIHNCQMSDIRNSVGISNIKDIFNENVSNASGGKSDFTTEYKGCYTFTSCKYKEPFVPANCDLERLNNEACSDLKLDRYKLSFVCKDKSKVKSHNHRHPNVKKYFDTVIDNNLLFDLDDIKRGIDEFHKLHKNKSYEEYCEYINSECLGNERETLIERLHQRMTLLRFIENIKKDEKKHLISHKTRSGKSITQLLIIKWLIENNKKVIFITSVPSTIINFINDLEKYIVFKGIKYDKLGGNKDDLFISSHSLTLCSIQYLKNDGDGNKKEFLKKQKYDVMVIDESHYGSSTSNTKHNIINIDIEDIRKSAKLSIFATGTSRKTQKFYSIKNQCVYKWDLYDESQMKLLHTNKYKDEEIIDTMTLRHGDIFKKVICDSTLNKDYTNMPTQMLMKASIPPLLVKQIEDYREKYNKDIGFSLKSLFSLQNTKERNENGVYETTYLPKFELEGTTDGEAILENYLDNIISENKMKNTTVLKRVEKVQTKYNSRKSTKESPKLIIMYLPTHTRNSSIDMLQHALIDFITRKNLWSKYNIVSANSKENMGDYKKEYNEEVKCAMKETKQKGKIGCILLLGDKGTTGITYEDCDVSIHLDDGHNLESQIQKRARPGTPAKDKTIFINVDMNIQRSLYTLSETIKQYQVGSYKNASYKDILVYLHNHNLFLWNEEDFNNGEMNPKELDSYFQKLAEKVSSEIDYVQIMNELCDEIDCNDDLKSYIDGNISNNTYKSISNPELEGDQKEVPKDNQTKIEIDRIKKEQLDKLDEDDINGKEEVEELIEDTINKTAELAKSKRGLPFLTLLLRVKKSENIKILLDTESNLIKNIIKPKINKIDEDNYIYDIYKTVMCDIIDKHQEIVNQIVEIYNNTPSNKLRDIIASHFTASAEEELENAEIPTPPSLCDDMLKPFPETFWTQPSKVGELCCGKGNFVLAIFDKFYEGLQEKYPDDYERCKIISTECLYFTDINPLDIFITSSILKCHIQSYCGECDLDYEFNSAVCNTLETNIKDLFKIDGFDAIIGNPPFNPPRQKGSGNTIWQLFTNKAIDEWLVDGGYLAYVHPPGWRKPNTSKGKFNGMYKKMAIDNQMIYLEMHNIKDGKKVFDKDTRYDWYLIEKTNQYKNTIIVDEDGKRNEINLSELSWLPNSNLESVIKILSFDDNTCEIVYSPSAYEHRKKWMSHEKIDDFKYTCIHSTPKSGTRYMYSQVNDRGHFGVPKVIFGEGGINNVIIDINGEYGLTNGAIGIKINNLIEGENYKKALESDKFDKFLKCCLFSIYRVDWNIFKDFKKDFWKEYINDETPLLSHKEPTKHKPLTIVSNNDQDMEMNTTPPSNQRVQLNETQLKKMTIPKLKTYINEHKLKIKLRQRKADLINAIIGYYKNESITKPNNTCPYIFTKGTNKGNQCTCKPKNGGVYCSKHKKYEVTETRNINKDNSDTEFIIEDNE